MSEKMNVHQRIAEVMKGIVYLSKDGRVEFSGKGYNVITEEKVTSVVRERLIENGLTVLPIAQMHKKEGNLTTVDTTYRITNIDNPSDYVDVVSSGTGTDTQDKGVGKAMTYSYKYLLLRTFAIPTGEDTDKVHSDEITAKIEHEEKKAVLSNLPISGVMVSALRSRFKKDNIDEDKVRSLFEIGLLETMTMAQHDNLNKNYSKVKFQCAGDI